MHASASPFAITTPAAALSLTGLVVVTAYYLFLFLRGRGPRRGWGEAPADGMAPPGGLSPGELRYLVLGRWDARCIGAVLVSLAEKGHLLIENEAGVRTLHRRQSTPEGLSEEEQACVQALFSEGRDRVVLQDGVERLTALAEAMCLPLEVKAPAYSFDNRPAVKAAIWFSVLFVTGTTYLGMDVLPDAPHWAMGLSIGLFFWSLWGAIWAACVGLLIWAVPVIWRRLLSEPQKPGSIQVSACLHLVFVFMLAVPLIVPFMAASTAMVAGYALSLVNLIGVRLLWRKRTALGDQLWHQTQAFARRLRKRAGFGGLELGQWGYAFALVIPAAGSPGFYQPGDWTVRDQWAFEANLHALFRLDAMPRTIRERLDTPPDDDD